MPETMKQKKAACAEYGRRKADKGRLLFKGMSMAQLRKWCKAKKLHKKKKKGR